jgi:hypothetical protein
MPTRVLPPIGYQGDYYVDEFTDTKIKQAWQELKVKNPAAAKKKILDGMSGKKFYPERRYIGSLEPKGAVNGNDDLKLTEIRRPAFFGQAPCFEDIAKAEFKVLQKGKEPLLRGPYYVLSWNEEGKTRSIRLKSNELEQTKHDVEAYKNFQIFAKEFVEVTEAMTKESRSQAEGLKKTSLS